MKKKGSFTIEAALLIPAIFMVVVMVMHFSFFLYNREAAIVIVSEAALMGVQMENEGRNEIKEKVTAFAEEETAQKLIFVSDVDLKVNVTLAKVEVRVDFIQKTPFREMRCQAEQKLNRLNPASFLWRKESLKKK